VRNSCSPITRDVILSIVAEVYKYAELKDLGVVRHSATARRPVLPRMIRRVLKSILNSLGYSVEALANNIYCRVW